MADGRSLLALAGSGVVGGLVAAVAGNQPWVATADGAGQAGDAVAQVALTAADSSSPLTAAVALVVLAAWGVVLVARGRFRVLVVWLALVASVGLLVVSVAAFVQAPRQLADLLDSFGAPDVGVERTLWSWAAVAGSVLATLGAGLAVRRVRSWPEMGRRYDGPAGAAASSPVAPEEAENIDLWKAMDDGRDPTA